jgi:hypothetical protein
MRGLRATLRKALPAAAFAAGLGAGGGMAMDEQPIWQPAIYCAALDFTRADILAEIGNDPPDTAGTPESADRSGRVYFRIAAEGLDCPPPGQLDAMIETARIGIAHRLDVAEHYGHRPRVMVRALASESELVCELHFDPDLMEAARAAEAETPPAPLCGADE